MNGDERDCKKYKDMRIIFTNYVQNFTQHPAATPYS